MALVAAAEIDTTSVPVLVDTKLVVVPSATLAPAPPLTATDVRLAGAVPIVSCCVPDTFKVVRPASVTVPIVEPVVPPVTTFKVLISPLASTKLVAFRALTFKASVVTVGVVSASVSVRAPPLPASVKVVRALSLIAAVA
ncbi:hypothetical protein AWB69_09253 [Caballeronia udeis]|uniref:Uncharacterized protein n=1 Tax=Caballeronia udeis TaxID=1232866 RepID=A0A158K162_9BURK|nr:hypothetical protein AWB69_09253 [Caballeronia udeis]